MPLSSLQNPGTLVPTTGKERVSNQCFCRVQCLESSWVLTYLLTQALDAPWTETQGGFRFDDLNTDLLSICTATQIYQASICTMAKTHLLLICTMSQTPRHFIYLRNDPGKSTLDLHSDPDTRQTLYLGCEGDTDIRTFCSDLSISFLGNNDSKKKTKVRTNKQAKK